MPTETKPGNPPPAKQATTGIMGKYKNYLSVKKFLAQKQADKRE
jgi:hypothetical protein